MTAAAATAVLSSSDEIFSRGTSAADEKSSIKGWMARAVAQLKELAPYAVLELVLPGGSLIAILLWLYRRAQSTPMLGCRRAVICSYIAATNDRFGAGVSCGDCSLPQRHSGSELTGNTRAAILYHMVKYKERQLDRTFAALVDQTRRAILARLEREDSASVSDLAKPFAIKLPAVMKHLDVLADAGLITRSKVGRTVTVRLRPEPMRQAVSWLQRYERFWSKSLDRLAAYAESKEAEARKKER